MFSVNDKCFSQTINAQINDKCLTLKINCFSWNSNNFFSTQKKKKNKHMQRERKKMQKIENFGNKCKQQSNLNDELNGSNKFDSDAKRVDYTQYTYTYKDTFT